MQWYNCHRLSFSNRKILVVKAEIQAGVAPEIAASCQEALCLSDTVRRH